MNDLPLLPTMGVGSYAAPGWYTAARRLMREGAFGEQDVAELMEDVTRVVVADQLDAGVDVLTDGELRRQRFVFEVYERIQGLRRVPPRRRLGIAGYDMAPHFLREAPLRAAHGLGTVEDFLALRRLAPGRPLKIALPGPLTFAEFVDVAPEDAPRALDELVGIVRDELRALVAAGADYVQLDEPAFPAPPYGLDYAAGAQAINRALAGLGVRTAVHVCYGNNAGRPFVQRRMGHLVPAMQRLDCRQLLLEFANREMAELAELRTLSAQFDIAAGVVDVKNFYLETPQDVARRIAQCLEFVPPERLAVTADCGFSALPRQLARDKLRAMVAGARLARERL